MGARAVDPIRLLSNLMWDPFQEMAPTWPSESLAAAFAPAFDVRETKDAYLFKADLPGVKEGDLSVTMTGNRLTVSGKREVEQEERGDTYYTSERSYGSFTRSFTLPEGCDAEHVQAELKHGVMTIAIAKKAELQPKQIAIRSEKAKA